MEGNGLFPKKTRGRIVDLEPRATALTLDELNEVFGGGLEGLWTLGLGVGGMVLGAGVMLGGVAVAGLTSPTGAGVAAGALITLGGAGVTGASFLVAAGGAAQLLSSW